MNNPYEDILPPEKLKIGRTTAWAITVVFLAAIVVPPLLRNFAAYSPRDGSGWIPIIEFLNAVRPTSSEQGIAQRLRGFETKLEENADFARTLRRQTQAKLTSVFQEGNNRTVIGEDGWLYFRPALQALTGYGPITPEPESVAKDPSRSSWKPALNAITHFADQLQERGIELVLVPAPVKPMIYPEHLTGRSAASSPVRHRDSVAFFSAIRSAGISVVDAADSLWEMKAGEATTEPLFLKQDTHWRPRGMQATVDAVAAHLLSRPWYKELPLTDFSCTTKAFETDHIGDLVEKLDLPEPDDHFKPESVGLTRVLDPTSGDAIASDPQSPIVVLGDSFVNIFHDPGLGFSIPSEDDPVLTGAGFAQHLAMKLDRPIDVIAINGEASTGVREQFARRYDDEVRSKKALIWVIAARDLFLSETPANGLVHWDDVTFNPTVRPEGSELAGAGQSFTVKGTITVKSAIPNPRESTYKDALYVVELGEPQLVAGKLPADAAPGEPLYIVLWAFKNRTYMTSSNIKEGQAVSFNLVPFNSKPELGTTTIEDGTEGFGAPLWFAEEFE